MLNWKKQCELCKQEKSTMLVGVWFLQEKERIVANVNTCRSCVVLQFGEEEILRFEKEHESQ